jgi:hypothetical protein
MKPFASFRVARGDGDFRWVVIGVIFSALAHIVPHVVATTRFDVFLAPWAEHAILNPLVHTLLNVAFKARFAPITTRLFVTRCVRRRQIINDQLKVVHQLVKPIDVQTHINKRATEVSVVRHSCGRVALTQWPETPFSFCRGRGEKRPPRLAHRVFCPVHHIRSRVHQSSLGLAVEGKFGFVVMTFAKRSFSI